MADLIQTRKAYLPDQTLSLLELPSGSHLWCMERPWIHDAEHGSKPSESCIPDGYYELVPHNGSDFQDTWALVNPDLQVWHLPDEMDGPGRYACVFHAGTFPRHFAGCIGVGLNLQYLKDSQRGEWKYGLVRSREAMAKLRKELVVGSAGHGIMIQPTIGTATWR